jgi:hypothetical protein
LSPIVYIDIETVKDDDIRDKFEAPETLVNIALQTNLTGAQQVLF